MFSRSLVHTLIQRHLAAMLLLLVALGAQAQSLDVNLVNNAGLMNLKSPEAQVFSTGQPTQEQLQALADAGVKHVINLRPASEMEFDEKAVVESLGMMYHSIPISGAQDVTHENAASLSSMLSAMSGQPVLVHCASGNRVGALMAVSAADTRGLSVDAAVEEGQRWGLTRLESAVRTTLSGN
ncbi:MAG: protein tyrosine phosphatase family protein [Gammaproteobacteria bacterium]|nr:protein tyrosine phosphatase family protein [Pseudomonadales bacterium]MCP5348853.1 protein tyrosine phosphatase family protein [Pseudomonadales bacterium]